MLLQTIKSRNLWLWGELIQDVKLQDEYSQLLAERNELEVKKSSVSAEAVSKNKELINPRLSEDQKKKLLDEVKDLNEDLSIKQTAIDNVNSKIKQKESEQNGVTKVTSKIIKPFKITALQSIDITWDNPIGESYGLTANFLQSWHNKPVNITFKGISYMGAFGGSTVGNLNTTDNDTKIKSNEEFTSGGLSVNSTARAISSGITSISNNINKFVQSNISGIKSDSSIEGKYDIIIDYDVQNINNLLSYYGEGLYIQAKGSPYIYLLMENPGSGSTAGNNSGDFVTFIGHIKNFTYSERTDKPFLYDYTVQFVGEPVLASNIKNAQITAKQDANSVKLTVVASDSGYSLGYGW